MRDEIKLPKALLRPIGRALVEHGKLQDGDRVVLGVSGGKDSLSLLHCLRHFQRHAPIHFDLAAITVDPQVEDFDPSGLKPYLAELGIPYFYESHAIAEQAKTQMKNDSFCAFCSRMKRGIMYTTCRREGYNVLALAQHLDDLAESFLMSAFHGGQLKTMKAHYTVNEGDLRVIRPLVYVRERQTRDFAHAAGLPVIRDNCPSCFSRPTQRQHMKELLAAEEKQNPDLFKSILCALRPLIAINSADYSHFPPQK
jgi:tRNA 2-thiocytidine biosynthesis protein TtcA